MVNTQSPDVIVAEEAASGSDAEQRVPFEEEVITGEGGESSDTGTERAWRLGRNNDALIRQVEAMLGQGLPIGQVLQTVFPSITIDVSQFSEQRLFGILCDLLDRPPTRRKLPHWNTLQDAIDLIRNSKSILILTGAGVSVSCGIPDFRSKDGIYARLHEDFPDLPDPTSMFDLKYFREDPKPFYDFAKEIFPGQFTPSVSHRFIKLLEDKNKLLRNYTQNIDTLEHQTGITRVVECHGSFSKATCTKCLQKFDGNVIKGDVLQKKVPLCSVCTDGVIKPDIVFFGEDLGSSFHDHLDQDSDKADLVIVIGTSLKVRPVGLIPFAVDQDVPQILINRESLPHYPADIELLGNCDDIVREICYTLGEQYTQMIESYDEAAKKEEKLENRKRKLISFEEFSARMKEEEESEAKKPKVEENPGPSNREETEERRYVNIESTLPPDSCVQVSQHQTLFPGAEMCYDRDTKRVCRPPPKKGEMSNMYSSMSDTDDSLDEEEEEEEGIDGTCSLSGETSNETPEVPIDIPSESCPANLDYEESDRTSAVDFRNACQDLAERF